MVFSHRTRLLTAGLALLLGTLCASAKASHGDSAAQPAEQGQATSYRVTGNVTDTQGEPLLGAYVALKGDDSVHAITGVDGNYSIDVPDGNAVLVFSYIGFTTAEERVSGRKILNVQLSEESTELSDAVVVAYGRQKRESVVASITTIAPDQLKVSTSRSVSNNLAGTVAGVLAIQRSGEPGYDNSTFWIRGISTFQGAAIRSCSSTESSATSTTSTSRKSNHSPSSRMRPPVRCTVYAVRTA